MRRTFKNGSNTPKCPAVSDDKYEFLKAELEELRTRVNELEEQLGDVREDVVTGEELQKAKYNITWWIIGFIMGILTLIVTVVGVTVGALGVLG